MEGALARREKITVFVRSVLLVLFCVVGEEREPSVMGSSPLKKWEGQLTSYIDGQLFREVVQYVDSTYLRFGGTDKIYGTDSEKVEELRRKAEIAELVLVPAKIRHLGTDRCWDILKNMYDYLSDKVEIKTSLPVEKILVENGKVEGVKLRGGEEVKSKFVVW